MLHHQPASSLLVIGRPALSRRRTGAFTIIELVMVVGVIMILSSIAYYGISHLLRHARTQATMTALETCRGMLETYAQETSFNGGRGLALLNGAGSIGNISIDSMAAPSGSYAPGLPANTNLGADPLATTEAVMGQLYTVPRVKSMFLEIPAVKFLKNAGGTQTHVLVDGWGNPIIFVPGGGLSGVTTGGTTDTVQSPTKVPFFVSGGGDSKFSTGDDNIYSFSN